MPYKDPLKQKEAQKEYRKRKRKYFIEIFGGSCIICGSKEQLEFDHIDRSTRTTPTTIWVMSRERITEELKKCQLLCKACHINKTHKERGDRILVHGTMSRGYRRGCHCTQCRKANADYEHARRLRGKIH